jgi:hypothetical protein
VSNLVRAEASTTAAPSVILARTGERIRAWGPLALVIVTFLIVSTIYNLKVPLYEAPDEIAHARYVRTIADDGTLPRFKSVEEYESWQPPLYYATGAAALKMLSLDTPPELEWNPNFYAIGDPKNFVHTSDEYFPYSEPVLGVHILRGVNTLFSVGTIIFIYFTAILVFPHRRLLAFTAAATASLIPQFAFISSTVSNDPASFFFASGTVYFGLRYLREASMATLLLAALAISLGALTKISTLVLGVVPLAAVLMQPIDWQRKIPLVALLVLFPLVIAGWFYLRSLIIWGAVYPDDLFWPLKPTPIWDARYREHFLQPLRESFWYAGGPANIRLSKIIYDVLDVASVLAVAGLIVTFVSSRMTNFEKRGLVLLSILPLLAVAMLLYFGVEHDFVDQGRYLMVAIPAFAILLPLGLGALFSRDRTRDHAAMLVLPALLLAINAYIFTQTLPEYY